MTERDELLRGYLKQAREAVSAAQPQCVIVASRHQLQLAIDRIDYVAAREGVAPGDTFAPVGAIQPDPRTDAILADRLAEALRLTAEWSMAIALPGWSWFDALQEYHEVRGHDRLVATGLPAGITEAEAAEPVWSLARIQETLDDPFVAPHEQAKAMRALRWHVQREHEVPEAEAAEECAVVRDLPPLGEEAGAIRGVPFLLEQLALLARESVYLWFNPERNQPWAVWTGAPAGTGGGQWGAGGTAQEALADAFQRVTGAIFDGRVVR